VGTRTFAGRGLDLDGDEELPSAPEAISAAAPAAAPVPFPPGSVRPSVEVVAEALGIRETVRLDARIALPGSPDVRAHGEALPGLFAADEMSASRDERPGLARSLLERWGRATARPRRRARRLRR